MNFSRMKMLKLTRRGAGFTGNYYTLTQFVISLFTPLENEFLAHENVETQPPWGGIHW